MNVFSDVGSRQVVSSDFIPVDTAKKYTISGLFKSAGSTQSLFYYGLAAYDKDKNPIWPYQVIRTGNDETITSYNSTSITVSQTIDGGWAI
jgi:hypothetical protein